MGTWGTGFWSNDITSDIRNSYMNGLRKKRSPEEVLAQLVDEYEMDSDNGYLCWLAVALLQWEYGHLSEAVKAKALTALHSGADEKFWMDESEKDRCKRREVMRQLEEKLLSTNQKPKKVRPYIRKQTPWKVGDILSVQFGTLRPYGPEQLWLAQGLYGAALIVDFFEMDLGDIYVDPVIVIYDWIGAVPAQRSDLSEASFFQADVYFTNKPCLFWIADIPTKLDYSRYGLQVTTHLEEIPFSKEELENPISRSASTECPPSWGAFELAIASHWLKAGRPFPQKKDFSVDLCQQG